MGMKFRKSKSSGPFRVTVSKSGLHTSVGGKGFRVGVGTNGKTRTTVSIPGTGISYTRTSGSGKKSGSHSRSTYSPSAQTSNPNYSSYPTYENGSISKSIIYFVVFGITLGLIIKHPSFVAILGVMALYFLFKGILNLPTKIIKALSFNFSKKKTTTKTAILRLKKLQKRKTAGFVLTARLKTATLQPSAKAAEDINKISPSCIGVQNGEFCKEVK